MGSNRSGRRRTQRMKRAKKDFERIAIKYLTAEVESKPAAVTSAVKK